MSAEPARVAVTGVGIVSAIGSDAAASMQTLLSGARGISRVELFSVEGHRCRIAAQVHGVETTGFGSRCEAMAVRAAREALNGAKLDGTVDIGVAVGLTTGGMPEAEALLAGGARLDRETQRRLVAYPLSRVTAQVRKLVSGTSRCATLSSACSSSAAAIALGARWIASGHTPYALVGGAEALCRLTFAGFDALGAMDEQPCRAFDSARAGLTLGEGAGFLVLEGADTAVRRGASILGFLDGWALGAEAFHVTQPEPSGELARALVARALDHAGMDPAELDLVNAHGTATRQNDLVEGSALRAALGAETSRVYVTSSKPQIGHTLGACGALEAGLSLLCMRAGVLPPAVGLESPDPEIPLRFCPAESTEMPIRSVLSTSLGFGGAGAALVFRAADSSQSARVSSPRRRAYLRAVTSLTALGVLHDDEHTGPSSDATQRTVALDPSRCRRFDEASSQVSFAVERLLERTSASPQDTGLVCANAYGNVSRSVAFLRRLFERGRRAVPPADFPHLVPGALAGNASIYNGLRGPVLGCADRGAGAELALQIAVAMVEGGDAKQVIAGAVEAGDSIVEKALLPALGDNSGSGGRDVAGFCLIGAEPSGALAEIADTLCVGSGEALPLAAPNAPERARVYSSLAPAALARACASTGWQDVARIGTPKLVRGDAASAYLMCLAASQLFAQQVDEALLVSVGDDVTRCCRLIRVGQR